MGGMRRLPPGIIRQRDSTDRPPTWYLVWYETGETGGQRVLLGRSERLERHLDHRFYPVDGSWPQVFHGWVRGVEWLLECWRSAKARSDACVATEDEQVREL